MSEQRTTNQTQPKRDCDTPSACAPPPVAASLSEGVAGRTQLTTKERLSVLPMTLRAAREYVNTNHRHHKAPQGGLFAVACELNGRVVGCAIVGKPVARMLNDGKTVEITRLCTDGTRNACSFLYRVCVRVARSMGYSRVLTYTLDDEGGASLRGAGFKLTRRTKAESWSRPSRARIDKHPTQHKLRWEAAAA